MLFVSHRIHLRKLLVDDAPSIYKMTTNEDIRFMTGTKAKFTIDEIEQYIHLWDLDPKRYDFAICMNGTNEMIGDIVLFDIQEDDKKAAFRIAMHELELTGQGYGPEAIQLLMDFSFLELKLNRLQLEVYSHNQPAIKAYKKLGFKQEGVLRQALFYDERYYDEIIMSLLKEEYEVLRQKKI